MDGIAEALQNMDFLEQITGMQISHNREMIELTIPDKTARIKIITEGLELDDIIKIDFRPDVSHHQKTYPFSIFLWNYLKIFSTKNYRNMER